MPSLKKFANQVKIVECFFLENNGADILKPQV
jgi:hypothetical protein